MTKIGSFLLLASCAHGWIEHKSFLTSRRQILRPVTFLSADSDSDAATDTENPCWQDLYDDDCGMDSVYGASFVAKEWIKKLPCAKGVEVSLR